jgi:nucleoside-diphosphate-sugar epimerase
MGGLPMNTVSVRRAFVTGATGFVGGAVCAELRAQGWEVTALVRDPAAAREITKLGVRLAPGDILDPASLATAIPSGVDAVFHIAGDTSLWRKRDAAQSRINIEGTHNVLSAARAARARRFVLTSTVSAYGAHEETITEESASHAADSAVNYERSKWQAEQLVRAECQQGLDAVILQPGAIIGPGDARNWGRMFLIVRDGKLPFLPPGRISFNHVNQIARAHVAAAERGRGGESYLLGGDSTSLAALVIGLCELLGRKPPRWTAPAGLLEVMGRVVGALTPASVGEPLMTRELAQLMSAHTICDSGKATRELGLRPTPLRDCLSDCHAWLSKEKLL